MRKPATTKGVAIAVILFASKTIALAHSHLDSAMPAAGSIISGSPDQLMLRFSEVLEPKFSGVEVRDAHGTRVDAGSEASGNTLKVSVKNLAPGVYTVSWHVLSVDTHKSQGTYSFRIGK